MDDFENEGSREQNNYGSGPFIGGDMHGDIRYEMLDPKTKTVLAKLSKDAPDLADLLRKALRDGVISPDVVDALQSAVRNINEDVAESLWFASKNINNDVADQILRAAEALDEARNGIDHTVCSLNATVKEVTAGAAERIERIFTPPPPERIVNWRATFVAFFLGILVGVLVVIGLLIHYHVRPF